MLAIYHQRISLHVIFNRWSLLTDYSMKKRKENLIAVCNWASSTCKIAINLWKAFHQEEKVKRIRNSFSFRKRESRYDSHLHGIYMNRSCAIENEFSRSFTTHLPSKSPLFSTNSTLRSFINRETSRTWELGGAYETDDNAPVTTPSNTSYKEKGHEVLFHSKHFLSKIQRKHMMNSPMHFSPRFQSYFNVIQRGSRPIEDLIKVGNSQIKTPDGARVPSWILDELTERNFVLNRNFRCHEQQQLDRRARLTIPSPYSYTDEQSDLPLGNIMRTRSEIDNKEEYINEENKTE